MVRALRLSRTVRVRSESGMTTVVTALAPAQLVAVNMRGTNTLVNSRTTYFMGTEPTLMPTGKCGKGSGEMAFTSHTLPKISVLALVYGENCLIRRQAV